MQESLVQLLGQEDSLEKEMATHSSILAWKIPMDRGIRKSIIHGVTRVRHDLGLNHHQQEGDGKSKHQILGINKLKWMGMREFNSDSHCIFSWGPETGNRGGGGPLPVRSSFLRKTRAEGGARSPPRPRGWLYSQRGDLGQTVPLLTIWGEERKKGSWNQGHRSRMDDEPHCFYQPTHRRPLPPLYGP